MEGSWITNACSDFSWIADPHLQLLSRHSYYNVLLSVQANLRTLLLIRSLKWVPHCRFLMPAFCQHGLIYHFRFNHCIYSVESVCYYLLPHKYCTWIFLSNIALNHCLLFISICLEWFPMLTTFVSILWAAWLAICHVPPFIKSSKLKKIELCYLKAWFYFFNLILRASRNPIELKL